MADLAPWRARACALRALLGGDPLPDPPLARRGSESARDPVALTAYDVRPVLPDERGWLRSVVFERWGDELVVGRGVTRHVGDLPALVAVDGDERVGLATYDVAGPLAELITLDALRQGAGVGRALVDGVVAAARAAGARRLVVMTTNDNLRALRFYQRYGFRLAALRAGAVDEARRVVKPSIPPVGEDGIPIRDEIDLALDL